MTVENVMMDELDLVEDELDSETDEESKGNRGSGRSRNYKRKYREYDKFDDRDSEALTKMIALGSVLNKFGLDWMVANDLRVVALISKREIDSKMTTAKEISMILGINQKDVPAIIERNLGRSITKKVGIGHNSEVSYELLDPVKAALELALKVKVFE